jgi:hypothetical protein
MAMQGGVLELDYCLAAENTGGGIVAYDTGSEVAIRRSVFREQEFSEVPLGDRGILIGYGASGTVEGSLLDHQPGAALQVTANGSALLVQGTIIRDTLPNAEGLLGYGISATADCGATLAWSCIEGSTTVGAFAWGGSSLVIDHAAVLGTKLGTSGTLQTQTFGDGITSKSSQVSVTGTVLANNARCGLFFVSSQGQLKKTLVRNNASYGLAMLNSIDVVWDELENLISGNCHELPAEFQSTQVTDSPGELPVPDPPSAQPFNLE